MEIKIILKDNSIFNLELSDETFSGDLLKANLILENLMLKKTLAIFIHSEDIYTTRQLTKKLNIYSAKNGDWMPTAKSSERGYTSYKSSIT